MPRGGKRQKPDTVSVTVLPVSTVLTMKEHMWGLLRSIVRKHSTVSLVGKSASDMAMKKFR